MGARLGACVIALLLTSCGAQPSPLAATPAPGSAGFRLSGDVAGELSAISVQECLPGSYAFAGTLGGSAVNLLLAPGTGATGRRPAVDPNGRPLVSLVPAGAAGPAGSAIGGTLTVAADGRSGSVDADIALNGGGRVHVSGDWRC